MAGAAVAGFTDVVSHHPLDLGAVLAGYHHLLQAAQRLQWDDAALDLAADAAAYAALPAEEQSELTRLLCGFAVAESAVAEQLAPFVAAAAADPAARACFAAQAVDEQRHARFFARVVVEVCGLRDPAATCPPAVHRLFGEELPRRAAALAGGSASLTDAVALYHLVLEGVAFGVGQEALLARLDRLPHVRAGVLRVQADERWHVGLGLVALTGRRAPLPGDVGELAAVAARCWDVPGLDADAAARRHARRLALLRA